MHFICSIAALKAVRQSLSENAKKHQDHSKQNFDTYGDSCALLYEKKIENFVSTIRITERLEIVVIRSSQ